MVLVGASRLKLAPTQLFTVRNKKHISMIARQPFMSQCEVGSSSATLQLPALECFQSTEDLSPLSIECQSATVDVCRCILGG